MAKGNANPAAGLGQAAKFTEVRQRLLFLIGALIVYRIGTFVPVPGIDPEALAQLFEQPLPYNLPILAVISGEYNTLTFETCPHLASRGACE